MKISLLKKAAVALLIFFTALGPLWPGALPAEPADENTGMLRYDSFGDLPPAQPLKFITHKGGAPGDPASGKPAEAANGGLPYEYNDAYDEDVNEWLRALFSSFSPLVSDDVWRILNNRRQVPWNILSQEIRQAVCRGFWWDTFNDYRDFLSAFDQPYMTTASFECGRVKASISSSCQRVSTHRGPECGATQIRLDDGEKQSEHFIFGRVKNLAPIGSAACYVVEGQ
ncbi:MAG: hypothetical protein LBP33_03505, partial [Candidatus Adiutrix sp.]|nr:hypothetical protein [Candidatus Adiutrix sp.]